jgi:phospho-N-acetylmuramoyl-pentapeptide-transferase
MTYALIAGCLAAVASALAGAPLVAFLRARKLGKAISTDGPESHLSKAGTPTLGGLLIVGVSAAFALAAAIPKDSDVWLPVAVMLVLCAIGLYDDLGTLIDREKREAHDRAGMILKLVGFTGVAVIAAWVLYDRIDAPLLLVPHRAGAYDIGPLYIVVAAFVIIATTSAVGVTDGLDMLCGGTSAVAFAAFGAIALIQHQTGVATFCFATVGALLGFLYWNAYPARVFMGDTGAIALGGALAVVGLMTGWWVLIPVIGVVFVIEIASDVIQIGYFRLTGGKRAFRMAPIHHHFEKLGWHETTVTARLIVLGVIGAMAGVALALW